VFSRAIDVPRGRRRSALHCSPTTPPHYRREEREQRRGEQAARGWSSTKALRDPLRGGVHSTFLAPADGVGEVTVRRCWTRCAFREEESRSPRG
jgi:hypothetical protein